jgi:alpha-D-xyloside xylohydrolase
MKLQYVLLISVFPLLCQGQAVKNVKQPKESVNVAMLEGTIHIYPLSDNAVRVKFNKTEEKALPEFVFTIPSTPPAFKVTETPSKIEIKNY